MPHEAVADMKGGRLIADLWRKMHENKQSPKNLASELGVTYVYLMALARGEKSVPGIDRRVIEACARYLEVPVSQVYLLADIIRPEDFFIEHSLDQKLAATYRTMRESPIWRGYTPSEATWNGLPLEVRLLVAAMFDRLRQKEILEGDMLAHQVRSHAG